jgi:multidrug efflux pump subunit AcrB
MSIVASEIGALSGALAQTKAGAAAADKQLTGVREGRTASLEAQAKQQSIADAGKAAGKATADPIKLKAVADVKVVAAPASVTRVDGTRAATLTASSESSNLGATTAQINAGIAALNLPDGVTVRVGGVSQQQSESFAQLGLAMVVAIFVVYLIMVATFGSLLQPLILLVSIPFAATGALALSLITDTALGVPSMIGLLMLIGIVVTNAIVLIDLINQKRKAGASVEESIRQGARLRVRPIVMTALATVFALIPMGLGLTGGGGFISKPLAVVVIGGLISSTLLTLILVPVLYDVLETWREKRALRKSDRAAARKAAATAPAPAPEA